MELISDFPQQIPAYRILIAIRTEKTHHSLWVAGKAGSDR
jgi:hypothetical protein